jgi:hypothetical protein
VWVALRVGILAFLVSALSGTFGVVLLPLGGFFAVYLYRRRTGQKLTMMNGAQLGWLSGIFAFLFITLILTLLVVFLSEPDMVAQVKQQGMAKSIPAAEMDAVIERLRSPGGIAALLASAFLTLTALPAIGGALGARLLGRNSQS